jgi:hypothetical protein
LYEKEKILLKTTENWRALFKNSSEATVLILTDRRLILKRWEPTTEDLYDSSEESIDIKEIENIDIETSLVNNPCIKFTYGNGLETSIRFYRTTPGTLFNTMLGSVDKNTAEISAYTSYWASMLTMARILYGTPNFMDTKPHQP